jgi:DNA-binding NarL/FixJ family response regulator
MDVQPERHVGYGPATEQAFQKWGDFCHRTTSMIQVLLAMKNRLLRESLARVLNRRGDLQVVGPKGPEEISEGDMAKSDCDVLLLDFVDPEWLLRTKVRNPCGAKTIRIVAIGMEAEPEQFLKAVRVGVIGYLLKDASAFDVVAAVRAAVLGKASCAPQLCTLLFHEVAKIPESCQSKQPRRGARLTSDKGTQREVGSQWHDQ